MNAINIQWRWNMNCKLILFVCGFIAKIQRHKDIESNQFQIEVDISDASMKTKRLDWMAKWAYTITSNYCYEANLAEAIRMDNKYFSSGWPRTGCRINISAGYRSQITDVSRQTGRWTSWNRAQIQTKIFACWQRTWFRACRRLFRPR